MTAFEKYFNLMQVCSYELEVSKLFVLHATEAFQSFRSLLISNMRRLRKIT